MLAKSRSSEKVTYRQGKPSRTGRITAFCDSSALRQEMKMKTSSDPFKNEVKCCWHPGNQRQETASDRGYQRRLPEEPGIARGGWRMRRV